MRRAYEAIKKHHRQIHGVVHSALVLRDKSLTNMDEGSFVAALSAKVDVSVRMAQVFGDEALDFVLFFSSMLSFSKAAGQSNYASGCSFVDAFAHHLGRRLDCPVKVMNWGYWGTVGVVASEAYRARMAQLGIGSIEVEEAMAALEMLLGGPQDQLAFVKTTRPLAIAATAEQLCVYPAQIASSMAKLAELQGNAAEAAKLEDRRLREEMDELLGRLLWAQLNGLRLRDQEQASIETISVRLGVDDLYGRWLEESLRILTGRGYLERVGDLLLFNQAAGGCDRGLAGLGGAQVRLVRL